MIHFLSSFDKKFQQKCNQKTSSFAVYVLCIQLSPSIHMYLWFKTYLFLETRKRKMSPQSFSCVSDGFIKTASVPSRMLLSGILQVWRICKQRFSCLCVFARDRRTRFISRFIHFAQRFDEEKQDQSKETLGANVARKSTEIVTHFCEFQKSGWKPSWRCAICFVWGHC